MGLAISHHYLFHKNLWFVASIQYLTHIYQIRPINSPSFSVLCQTVYNDATIIFQPRNYGLELCL